MTDCQTTHAISCWSWGPKHYECAVREIEALRAEIERLNRLLRSRRNDHTTREGSEVAAAQEELASFINFDRNA